MGIFAGLTHLESNSIVSSEIQHPWVTYSARRSTGSVYKTARVPLEQLSVRLCLSVHHIGAATWLSSTENGKSSAVKILAIIWQPLVCYFFTFCFYVKKIVTSYFFFKYCFQHVMLECILSLLYKQKLTSDSNVVINKIKPHRD